MHPMGVTVIHIFPLCTPCRPACTDLGELIRSLCADPAFKFIAPMHVEYTNPTHTWDQAVQQLSHPPLLRISTSSSTERKPSALSILLISRSEPSGIDQLVRGVNALERKLKLAYNTVSWNPFPVDFWFSSEHRLKTSKRATLLANTSVVADYFETALQRAKLMFREKAYLHWYTKYGCEESTFEEAFEVVRGTTDRYTTLNT